MGKGIKGIGGQGPIASKLAVGVIVSMLVTLVGVAICATLISQEMISVGGEGYFNIAILVLSAICGSMAATGKRSEKRLHTSLLAGTIYMFVLLSMTALIFGGQYDRVGVTAIAILSGCILAVLLGEKRKKSPKLQRGKKRRR